MIILLCGAAIIFKTFYQKSVALSSSTEAEFVSASDAGKMILYIRSILIELGFDLSTPTKLYVDNTGAVFMVEAQAPTKRTRHVDIRYFALLDWSRTGRLAAVPIPTDLNISDSMTKATGRIKFHQHADNYMGRVLPTMGRVLPTYVTDNHPQVKPVYLHNMDGQQPPISFSALRYSASPSVPLWLQFVSESMGGGGDEDSR